MELEPPKENSYYHQCMRNFIKKRYVEQIWPMENVHEMLWWAVQQRPKIREFVVRELREHGDEKEALFWEQVDTGPKMDPIRDHETVVIGNPLDPNLAQGFLQFPREMSEIIFVDTPEKMQNASADLEERVLKHGQIVVGLDSEWMAFSTVTILQVALRDVVYIVDLDLQSETVLEFLRTLFADDRILKLGFQFHQDIKEMRKKTSLSGCEALYGCMNRVCLNQLIVKLVAEAERRPDCKELLQEFGLDLDLETMMTINDQNEDPIVADRGKPGSSAEEVHIMLEQSAIARDNENSTDFEAANPIKDPDVQRTPNSESFANSEETLTINGSTEQRERKRLSREEKRLEKQRVKEERRMNDRFRLQKKISNFGLSQLCERMLGLPLDKSNQKSVWRRRPLRTMQLRYAALDSVCELMLFDKCKEWAEKMELDMNELLRKLQGTKNKRK